MQARALEAQERLAIESILDDAEKSLSKSSISQGIEALDEKCKGIWDDWEYAVHPFHMSPDKKSTTKMSPTKSSVARHVSIDDAHSSSDDLDADERESELQPTPTHPPSRSSVLDDGTRKSHFDKEDIEAVARMIRERRAGLAKEESAPPTRHDIDSDSDADEDAPINLTRGAVFDEGPRAAYRKPKRRNPPARKPKGVVTKATAAVPTPFARSDAARLRQENQELRSQVARLQATLDRAQQESARVKEELHKTRRETQRHKSTITFLKEEKLYHRK